MSRTCLELHLLQILQFVQPYASVVMSCSVECSFSEPALASLLQNTTVVVWNLHVCQIEKVGVNKMSRAGAAPLIDSTIRFFAYLFLSRTALLRGGGRWSPSVAVGVGTCGRLCHRGGGWRGAQPALRCRSPQPLRFCHRRGYLCCCRHYPCRLLLFPRSA